MLESPERHLTDEELNRNVDDGADSPAVWPTHLRNCPQCRERAGDLITQQRKLDALRCAEPDAPSLECPGADRWWRIALGSAQKEDAEAPLAHAARCSRCARKLRLAIEDLAADSEAPDSSIDNLPFSTPEAITRQATHLARATRAGARRSPFTSKMWLIAAAAVLAVIPGAIILMHPAVDDANRLLAQANEEGRVSELRFPGARYAPLRQERGETTMRSQPLVEASVKIAGELSQHPENGHWLQLTGRVNIIEWRYDQAISDLRKAEALLPGDPYVLADMAAAYFERAQASDSQADYRVALDMLSRAIDRQPKQPELRFNRAVVLGHLSENRQAIREWNDFLSLESKGGWANEARSRLAELRKSTPE